MRLSPNNVQRIKRNIRIDTQVGLANAMRSSVSLSHPRHCCLGATAFRGPFFGEELFIDFLDLEGIATRTPTSCLSIKTCQLLTAYENMRTILNGRRSWGRVKKKV